MIEQSGWTISDVLTLLSFAGAAIAALVGWLLRIEIFMNKVNSKVDNNSTLDEERVKKIDSFMSDLKLEITAIHKELKDINEFIISQKARNA